jgi:phage tail-like protein
MTSKSRNIIVVLGVVVVVILALAVAAYSFGLLGERAAVPALSGAAGRPSDPMIGISYRLSCPGKFEGYFMSAYGLGSSVETITQKIVDQSGREINILLPGRISYEKLVLSRGATSDRGAWDWYGLVLAGRMNDTRTPCELSLLDTQFTQVAVWRLTNAWPSGYTALTKPEASGTENLPIETLTIVYEAMERTK